MQQEPSAATALRRVTGHAGNQPGQGPFLRVSLTVEGRVIREATYETYQCPGCIACGKSIVQLVTGKSLEEAHAVQHADLVALVGTLPRHRQICYGLALLALTDALRNLS